MVSIDLNLEEHGKMLANIMLCMSQMKETNTNSAVCNLLNSDEIIIKDLYSKFPINNLDELTDISNT